MLHIKRVDYVTRERNGDNVVEYINTGYAVYDGERLVSAIYDRYSHADAERDYLDNLAWQNEMELGD